MSPVYTFIINPEWPISGLEGQPEWYKVCIGRAFFPQFFPAWDVIVYLDSDTWLQNTDAIDTAVEGAWQDGFAACPMTDRNLWPLTVYANVVFSIQWHRNCLEQYFGADIAQQFQLHPILSGSLFAGRRDAPHWAVWQRLMVEGLRRKIHYDIDQASMTLAIHQSRYPTHFLSVVHHWIGHLGSIGLETRTGLYVEPYLPHQTLSSLSLAAHSKSEPVIVKTTDGRTLSRLLRYGQQHIRYPIQLNLGGNPQPIDGIASPRFQQAVCTALGSTDSVSNPLPMIAVSELSPHRSNPSPAMQIKISNALPAEIATAISTLQQRGYVCYAMADGQSLLAIENKLGLKHFFML